jgi:serine/threonine protein kinase
MGPLTYKYFILPHLLCKYLELAASIQGKWVYRFHIMTALNIVILCISQCEGRQYDQKSDIWALGCILYEMACLQKTFEGSNLPALVNKIMKVWTFCVCRFCNFKLAYYT